MHYTLQVLHANCNDIYFMNHTCINMQNNGAAFYNSHELDDNELYDECKIDCKLTTTTFSLFITLVVTCMIVAYNFPVCKNLQNHECMNTNNESPSNESESYIDCTMDCAQKIIKTKQHSTQL